MVDPVEGEVRRKLLTQELPKQLLLPDQYSLEVDLLNENGSTFNKNCCQGTR